MAKKRTFSGRLLIAIAGALVLWLGCGANAFGAQSAALAWDPSASPSVAGYAVYIGSESGDYSTRIDVGTNTTFDLDDLEVGTTNYIAVAAYGSDGSESQPSSEIVYVVPGLLQVSTGSNPQGVMNMFFAVAPGHWYEVLASADLVAWTSIWQSPVVATSGWLAFSDPTPMTLARRFYRLALH
jgi:hypothetical protein